ncbi:hypothetical protein [Lacipirellula limnantheis]|nr:hypothetical protein [Lacipirellula limnantheis]
MAFPTLTTCTKCGKPASMTRMDVMVTRPASGASLEGEEVKLGYSYAVDCPHCGFSFTSLLGPLRSVPDPGGEAGG